jgi:glutamate dehydrogenase
MTASMIRSSDSDKSRDAAARISEARALIDKQAIGFFDALYAGALPDDVLRVRPERLAALARALFDEAASHAKGEIRVVILDDDETRESVAVAINDDRPFLFDSILLAARVAGARLRAVFHPIVTIGEQRTSVIALVCDGISGEAERNHLIDTLREACEQGRVAVRDWRAMLGRLTTARDGLKAQPPKTADGKAVATDEDTAFLDWLGADHFTFLGARDYVLVDDDAHGRLEPVADSGLGVLSDPQMRILWRGAVRSGLTAEVRAYLDEKAPVIVTKSVTSSLVHRRAHMDYIGVKTFDAQGNFNGERRFVGLFTSSAYNAQPRDIPVLRGKIAAVTARAGFAPASHDGKALTHILDTFPRDEMFQVSEDELHDIALGILRQTGLPRLKLFLRFDRFDRFVSAILLAPRDRLDDRIRVQIHALLADALNGRMSAFDVGLDDSPLARLHYVIGRNDGPLPPVDVRALEHQIAAVLETWDDAFATALCAEHGEREGLRRLELAVAQFSPGYRESFPAHDAVRDLRTLETVADSADSLRLRARAWRKPGDSGPRLRLKLYVLGEVLPLSASLPVFENLGLKVIAEDAFPVSFTRTDGTRQEAVILDFLMERADGIAANLDAIREPLEDAIHAVLRGEAESDGFNRLVMGAGLGWRDVVILRALAKFLRQAAVTFSQDYMEQALVRNPDVAGLLVALFQARHDPKAGKDRDRLVADAAAQIEKALRDVPSLDDDRIIRRFRNTIEASLRTNYWQKGSDGASRPAVAIKFDSAALDELPAPRPWREIFVYAPSVEGVHLRFGRIARGGIRWSDRREDFRTEILGLVKAQQVKNAVIVPVGAKGGFFPKAMPANPTREQAMAVGIAAYKLLINSLLDVTDNLDANGAVVPPPDVLRPDGDDPYLVVAADKGTATFSDIANGIAIERGYWLGDAFASGGSVGYDHKKMGITARGAWEAIKRHFRELSTDIQATDFTVVGVGDMSGDVFGNGMLLSRHTRLLAAFDHRHIFLDPSADAETGFKERTRLFALPRSSWDDYNKTLIGNGGGVFPRTLKEIALTPEVQALIGSDKKTLSPATLINALLKARVDLLWFGGIGTYIKASSQTNLEAGDRANDGLRVNGSDVRAKVVGEGANLGVTQLGRIEYARSGGRIDTDAVDNSAGVDTSDHEVNLKILLSGPVARGELTEDARNALLAAMTDDVARLVLADNYDQTLALSVAEATANRDVDADGRFIRDLELRGKLDRAVEFLPADTAMMSLGHDGGGLTRPELAVLLAYAKLDLDAEILSSDLPDDPAFASVLTGYFPRQATDALPKEPQRHRLKREIVSTGLANRIVNLAGPAFVLRMRELSGATGAGVARAFAITDGAFGLSALKARIDALDGKADAAGQIRAYGELADHLRRVTPWFLARESGDNAPGSLAASIAMYRAGTEALRHGMSPTNEENAAIVDFEAAGLPHDLAADLALLPRLAAAPDVALLVHEAGADADAVVALYFALGQRLGLDRLRSLASRLTLPEHWDRMALRRLLDDLSATQRSLARGLLNGTHKNGAAPDGAALVEQWADAHAGALERTRSFLTALEGSGELSISKLMLASSQVQNLA